MFRGICMTRFHSVDPSLAFAKKTKTRLGTCTRIANSNYIVYGPVSHLSNIVFNSCLGQVLLNGNSANHSAS